MPKFDNNKKENSEERIRHLKMEVSLLRDAYFQLKKTKSELEDKERKLREAQALGGIGNWEYDLKTKKIFWSDQVYKLYERDPALGPPTAREEAEYYSKEQAKLLRSRASECKKTGQEIKYDIVVNLPSGKHGYFSAVMGPVYDRKKRVVKLFGTVHNITERKKTEDALKESEQRFRTIFDSAGDGMLLADAEKKEFFIGNKSICQMLGYSPEEITGLGIMDIHPRKDLPHVLKQFERQARGEITLAEDLPVKRKDGSIFYADVNAAPFVLAGRKYVLGTFRDITERRESQEKIAKLSAVVEQSSEGMAVAGLNGDIVFANRAWAAMHGYDFIDKLVGKNLSIFHSPEQLERDVRPFNEKVKKNGSHSGEVGHIKKDGTPFPTLMTTTLLKNEQGKPYAIAGIARDITEIKKTEYELRASEERYRTLYDTSADAIMILTPDKGFFAGNPATIKMFACKNEAEFIKQTPGTISPPLQPDGQPSPKKAMKMINIALKKGTNFFEWTHRRLTGEDFYATVLLTRMNLGDETVLQATVRDISAEKASEQRLLMLSQAVKQARDGVVVTGMDRKIIFANDIWLKGHGTAGVAGALLDNYFQPEEKENYRSLVRFLDTQASMVRGFRCRGARGLIYPCLVTVSTLKDQKERPFAILHTFRDITDQQNYEQSLKRVNNEMKKAYEDMKRAQEKLKEQFEITQRLNRHMVGRELKMVELKEQLERCRRGGGS